MMGLIKNFDTLAATENRKKALELVEAALSSIQPSQVLQKNITLQGQALTIRNESFNIDEYKRIFVVGFGKGSSGVSKHLENLLGEKLTEGTANQYLDSMASLFLPLWTQ